MPIRPILQFRNRDSTKDINDQNRDLFHKGIFSGGDVIPVSGSLQVDVLPFATVGADGMFVREDSESRRLSVQAGVRNYIVIRQIYVDDGSPITTLESLPESSYISDADFDFLIVFAVVDVPPGAISTTSSMIEFFERDVIDPLGRLNFRGRLTALGLLPDPGLNSVRPGDFYIITDGAGDQPAIYAWNGASWVNLTAADETLDLLLQHIQNLPFLDFPGNPTPQPNDSLHLTKLQADAAIGTSGSPSSTNRYVTSSDTRIPTQNENDALQGGASLEDSIPPSNTNRYVTSAKVLVAPAEKVFASPPVGAVELTSAEGPFFVKSTQPGAGSGVGTSFKFFNIYKLDENEDMEYVNAQFQSVRVIGVFTDSALTQPLNTATDPRVDALGFFVGSSLYLQLNVVADTGFRIAYGKRTKLGDLKPEEIFLRRSTSGQIDARVARMLSANTNPQFDNSFWDNTVLPGHAISFSNITKKFVKADPNAGFPPVGVRGNANNVIQSGLYEALVGSPFSENFFFVDKTSPGDLTTNQNEWFVGRGIAPNRLLVSVNPVPIDANGVFFTPIQFPVPFWDPSVQPGQVVSWFAPNARFERADTNDPVRAPMGVRGVNNNLIQSGLFTVPSGSPFISGQFLYAGGGALAGQLVTTPNEFFVARAVSPTQIVVNARPVPITHTFGVEHDRPTGFHKFGFGNQAARDAITGPAAGMIFIRTDTVPFRIDFFNGSTWQAASSERDIPSGSRMLFIQASVPTGWTLDSSIHDRMIRVVNNSAGFGNDLGGSWAVSGFQANGVALTLAQIPPHTHPVSASLQSDKAGGAGHEARAIIFRTPSHDVHPDQNPASAGSGQTHSHPVSNDGNWRPLFINAIVCVRN